MIRGVAIEFAHLKKFDSIWVSENLNMFSLTNGLEVDETKIGCGSVFLGCRHTDWKVVWTQTLPANFVPK